MKDSVKKIIYLILFALILNVVIGVLTGLSCPTEYFFGFPLVWYECVNIWCTFFTHVFFIDLIFWFCIVFVIMRIKDKHSK